MSSSSKEASSTCSLRLRALSSIKPAPVTIPDRAVPTSPVDPVSLPVVARPILPTPLPAAHSTAQKVVKHECHLLEDERCQALNLQEQLLIPQGGEDPHGLFVTRPKTVGLCYGYTCTNNFHTASFDRSNQFCLVISHSHANTFTGEPTQ
jgi:hypothetical protein